MGNLHDPNYNIDYIIMSIIVISPSIEHSMKSHQIPGDGGKVSVHSAETMTKSPQIPLRSRSENKPEARPSTCLPLSQNCLGPQIQHNFNIF